MTFSIRAAVVAVLLSLSLAPGPAPAQDPARLGKDLVGEFCARCHAIGRTGDSAFAAAPPFRTLGSKLDLDDLERQLRRGLLAGHPDMPTFKFSAEDSHAVAVYLRSIQD